MAGSAAHVCERACDRGELRRRLELDSRACKQALAECGCRARACLSLGVPRLRDRVGELQRQEEAA